MINADVFVVEMGCMESARKGAGSSYESCKGPALQLHAVDRSHHVPAVRRESAPRSHSDADELLTGDERAVLKSDWLRLTHVDQQDMGMRVFLRIFELEPSTQSSFRELSDLRGAEQLRSHALFRYHGARFMRAVTAAVDNVDALDLVVIPNLVQLGRLHRSVDGLSWHHLLAFEQAMAEVWAAELKHNRSSWSNSTSAVVWGKVFRLITSKVYEGFQMSSSENSSVAAVKDDLKTANDEHSVCQAPST